MYETIEASTSFPVNKGVTIAFCLATVPLLAHPDTRYGLERIPDSELSFPEDHLSHSLDREDRTADDDLILTITSDEQQQQTVTERVDKDKMQNDSSENTPLLSGSLDV